MASYKTIIVLAAAALIGGAPVAFAQAGAANTTGNAGMAGSSTTGAGAGGSGMSGLSNGRPPGAR